MRPLTALSVAFSILAAQPVSADDVMLLSIKGVPLDQAHHLTKLVIRTWGVEVLEVCHIPHASVVSVDFDIDPGGLLTWKANSWHGELDLGQLKTLSSLFLVRISGYQKEPRGDPRGEYHPASFEGVATIATIEEPTEESEIQLRSGNFGLASAARCPDPIG